MSWGKFTGEVDFDRLERLAGQFKFESDGCGRQLVWSADRNQVDPEHYFDWALYTRGNCAIVRGISWICLTVGDWLYCGWKPEVMSKSDSVLLYRVPWSAVEITGVEPDGTVLITNKEDKDK